MVDFNKKLGPLVLDTECYINYWLLKFRNRLTGEIYQIEMLDDEKFGDWKLAKHMMENRQTFSFNGNNYDIPMIYAAFHGYSNAKLKKLSDEIIMGNRKGWQVIDSHDLRVPQLDHIDVIEVCPLTGSLKKYAGRLHAQKLQDLPIKPDAVISSKDANDLDDYCGNDLVSTDLVCEGVKQQIDLRIAMTAEYGQDLRSKSDAQIAEAVIKSQLLKQHQVRAKKPSIPAGTKFHYDAPQWMDFQTPELQKLFEDVKKATFRVNAKGGTDYPEALSGRSVTIGNATYQLGIGGLHSKETTQSFVSDGIRVLEDTDVASYYPSIVVNENLYPPHIGPAFVQVYKRILDNRLKAKKAGDKITADSLKIVVNSGFGKFGSQYSALYSPKLMIQVTVTGQLALLMLIEALENVGIPVVSANTDGVVTYAKHSDGKLFLDVVTWWQIRTGFATESTRYKALYQQNVNNYIAIGMDGKVKLKGYFANPWKNAAETVQQMQKNPEMTVCIEAVVDRITKGTSISRTIRACTDIRKFIVLREVKGWGTKDGKLIGKVVRYYYSTKTSTPLLYATNGNKVPNSEGAMPCMELPDQLPDDIDYEKYQVVATEMLRDVGFKTALQAEIDGLNGIGKPTKLRKRA